MVNPRQITDFNRTTDQLQEFLLFAICVAGKNSRIQAQKLDDFLRLITNSYTAHNKYLPRDYFHAMRWAGGKGIDKWLRVVRMGQYNRIGKAFHAIACDNPDLRVITLEGLERVKGVGLKTSRFFMLHTWERAKCAVLDTHILKYLRDCGYDVPKSTPQSIKVYRKWESTFLYLYWPFRKELTLAEFDLKIWKKYAK